MNNTRNRELQEALISISQLFNELRKEIECIANLVYEDCDVEEWDEEFYE